MTNPIRTCATCAHCTTTTPPRWSLIRETRALCAHPALVHPVDGRPQAECSAVRSQVGACGVAGDLWASRAEQPRPDIMRVVGPLAQQVKEGRA